MKNTTNNTPCYIPLNSTSQGTNENILYYNANAPLDDIYESAIARLHTAINLAETLHQYNDPPPPALQSFAATITLLLNDSCTLLEELNPIALKIRNEKTTNQ